jgi:hypothetical protein
MKITEEKNYAWFKFFPSDWRAGTAHLTGPQANIHLNFILHALDSRADHIEIGRCGGDLAADILAASPFLSRVASVGNNPTSRKNFEIVLARAWQEDAAAPEGKRRFRCPMLAQIADARLNIEESRKGAGKAIAAAAAAKPPKGRHHVGDFKNMSAEDRALFERTLTDIRKELSGGTS